MVRDEVLLQVENLHVYFPLKGGAFRRKIADIKAVDGISFYINSGETLGLVGETGCGKTTTGRGLLRLLKITGGKVFFEGKDLGKLSSRKMTGMRRHIQMIFEDPSTSLNPCMPMEEIFTEPLKIHNLAKDKGGRNYLKKRGFAPPKSLLICYFTSN